MTELLACFWMPGSARLGNTREGVLRHGDKTSSDRNNYRECTAHMQARSACRYRIRLVLIRAKSLWAAVAVSGFEALRVL